MDVGETYHAWLILEDLGSSKFKCLCTACGKSVRKLRKFDLAKGNSKACRSCAARARQTTHGMADSAEYSIWVGMIQRCHNEKSKDYPKYGARGIVVDPMWRESFEAFYMHMGPRPSTEYSVERLDVDGNYEPSNCIWATATVQNRNRRTNIVLTVGDESKTLSEWALDKRAAVGYTTMYKRITLGWRETRGDEAVITMPAGSTYGED